MFSVKGRSNRKENQGQALVEFTLLFTFLALLLMGVLGFGLIFIQQIALLNTTRSAARAATVQDARLEYCDPNQPNGHSNDFAYDMAITALGTLEQDQIVSITIYDPLTLSHEDVLDGNGTMLVQNFPNQYRCSLYSADGDIGIMIIYSQEMPVPLLNAITGDPVNLWARAVFPLQ
ncbi:MAG: pilus assembly protein [Anaerolineae bacterium]|nr:pilus assembly protein [Anaerolineae bacterium]